MIKLLTLTGSIIGLLIAYIFLNPIKFNICNSKYEFNNYVGCLDKWSDQWGIIVLSISVCVLIFSVIIFRMHINVFKSWAKFSAWYIPLLVVAHFVFSGSSSDFGAAGAIQDSFNKLMLGLVYAVYVVVSIVKIVRARRA